MKQVNRGFRFSTRTDNRLGLRLLDKFQFFGLDILSYAKQLDLIALNQRPSGYWSTNSELPVLKLSKETRPNVATNRLKFALLFGYIFMNAARFLYYLYASIRAVKLPASYLDSFQYFAPFPAYLQVSSGMSSLVMLCTLFSLHRTLHKPLTPKSWWMYIFATLDHKAIHSHDPICAHLNSVQLRHYRSLLSGSYIVFSFFVFFYDICVALNFLSVAHKQFADPQFFPYILTGLVLFHLWFMLAYRLQLYLIMIFLFIARYLQLLAHQVRLKISKQLNGQIDRVFAAKWHRASTGFDRDIRQTVRQFASFITHLAHFNASFWNWFFICTTGFGTPELLSLTYLVLNEQLLPIPYVVCLALCFNFYLMYVALYFYSARINHIFNGNYRRIALFCGKLLHYEMSQQRWRQLKCRNGSTDLDWSSLVRARCSAATRIKLIISLELMSARHFPVGIRNGSLFVLSPWTAFKFGLLTARFYLLCDIFARVLQSTN